MKVAIPASVTKVYLSGTPLLGFGVRHVKNYLYFMVWVFIMLSTSEKSG
jgi:hypothetical protein